MTMTMYRTFTITGTHRWLFMELEYIGELKKELVDFFIEMQEYRQYFKKKTL